MEYNTKEYIDSLKQKYKTDGLACMSEMEILELLLSYGKISYKNIHNVACELMKRFYSLYCIFERSPQMLMETDGMNTQSAIILNMQSSLFRVYKIKIERAGIDKLTDENSSRFVRSLFVGHSTEHFYAIMLSEKNKILSVNLLFSGTINRTGVYTRRIIELTLQSGAAKVLFVHNHPNGIPLPSSEDIKMTANLYDALAAVGVQIYDHIIVTEKETVSMKNDIHVFETFHTSYDTGAVII